MLIDFLEVLSVNLHRLSHVVHWVAIRQFLVHVKCFLYRIILGVSTI